MFGARVKYRGKNFFVWLFQWGLARLKTTHNFWVWVFRRRGGNYLRETITEKFNQYYTSKYIDIHRFGNL